MAYSFCVFSRLSKTLVSSVSLTLLMSTAAWAGYDEDIAPIIKANCTSCHAKQAPKLETYDDVVKAVAKIVASITIDPNGPEKDKLMPKGKKLDAKDIEKIKSECQNENLPLIEEFDFRQDNTTPDLNIELQSTTTVRDYQE